MSWQRRAMTLRENTELSTEEAEVWALWEKKSDKARIPEDREQNKINSIAEELGYSEADVRKHLDSVRGTLNQARRTFVELSPGQKIDAETGARRYDWELPLSNRPLDELAPWQIERELETAAIAFADLAVCAIPPDAPRDFRENFREGLKGEGLLWAGIAVYDRLRELLGAVHLDPSQFDPFDTRAARVAQGTDNLIDDIITMINVPVPDVYSQTVEFEGQQVEVPPTFDGVAYARATQQAKQRIHNEVQRFTADPKRDPEMYCGGARVVPPSDWEGTRREWYEEELIYAEDIPQPIIERILDGMDPVELLSNFEVDGQDLLYRRQSAEDGAETVYKVEDEELIELINGEVTSASTRYRMAADAFTEGSRGLDPLDASAEGSNSETDGGGG